MNFIIDFLNISAKIAGCLLSYRIIYVIIGFFTTRKYPKAKKQHKYAVLVAARNEEKVIGNLIESIKAQDYPEKLVTIFVVADNCTDKTAQISRNSGAICYERFDPDHRTKGFALQYLVERIQNDFGIEAFEGYFIFDSDNLLKSDFISRMNESFDSGDKIVTSYRNTKNFGDNWISASYGIHWLRTVRYEHRARSVFHLATRIQGTGFLFANEIIRNGWNYTSLTEDRAFAADSVVSGYQIAYNNEAEFYDEQPVSFKIAMRQRLRWSKGFLQAFAESGGKLFVNVFKKHSFMCYDMLSVVFPLAIFSVFKNLAVYLLKIALLILAGKTFGAIFTLTALTVWAIVLSYLEGIITAIYIFIIERKRLPSIKWYKKAWFSFTFPMFDVIGKLTMCIALFMKVEWKPIPHESRLRISDIEKDKTFKNDATFLVTKK